MKTELKRDTIIFVLRVWREYQQQDRSDLRGELEDLASRKKWAFSSGAALEQLVREHCQPDQDQGGR